MPVASARHPAIRYIRALERTSVRREEGAYLAEGVRLVGEALETGQSCPLAIYDPTTLGRSAAGSRLQAALSGWAERTLEVDSDTLRRASLTESPSGVVAVLRLPVMPILATHRGDGFGLVLDSLSDPGNAGTILRTAAAFGVNYVITTPSSVDLFSPKVVRAGMGAHFRLPLYSHIEWADIVAALPNVELVAADSRRGPSVSELQWPAQTGLVIGSEAGGVSEAARSRVQHFVHIPMTRGVESLNAAVSAGILLFAALGNSHGVNHVDDISRPS